MYDTSAKRDWDTLQSSKVEGALGRERLEGLKKKIEKPSKPAADAEKASPKVESEEKVEQNEKEEEDPTRVKSQKVPKKSYRHMKDLINETVKNNFANEEAKVSIRPDFDNLRFKIREEVSEKIDLSNKLLQKTKEEQILDTFAKNHIKIKKVKADSQRMEAPKDFVLGQDNNRDVNVEYDSEDDEYINFKKINQDKVDRFVREELNRNFPHEIENIIKLEEKKYILLNNNKKQGLNKIDPFGAYSQLDKKSNFQEDVIEAYSVVIDKSNKLQPVPFFRELGPYARDVVNIKNESKLRNNKLALDLMDEKEFYIDDSNITFENILNIVTGRISAKRLKKILNNLDYTECSDDGGEEHEDLDEYVPIQGKKNLEELQKQFEKEKSLKFIRAKDLEYINSVHPQPTIPVRDKLEQEDLFERSVTEELPPVSERAGQYADNDEQDDFERIENPPENINLSPQRSVGLQPIATKTSVDVEDYAQQFPTPKEEDLRNIKEIPPEKPAIQLPSEPENVEISAPRETNVNTLLKEIEDLKQAKNSSDKLPKLPSLREVRQQLYDKMEDKLAQLLYLIADDPGRTKTLKENLQMVIKDINVWGNRVLDGHEVKKLLPRFLVESKELFEEKEKLKIEGTSDFEVASNRYDRDEKLYRPADTRRTENSEAYQTHTERMYSSSDQERKRINEKLSLQNTLKSQKLPQPFEVPSHYMKQTQSSLRRLHDVKGNAVKQKLNGLPQERRDDWIGGNNDEDISDDDEWTQI